MVVCNSQVLESVKELRNPSVEVSGYGRVVLAALENVFGIKS